MTDSQYPDREFHKFLAAACLMSAAVLVPLTWGNWKVCQYRRFRERFLGKASQTCGYVEQSEQVFLDRHLRETKKRGTDRCYWVLWVRYENRDLGQEDVIFSDPYCEDPLRFLPDRRVEVYYHHAHAVVGNVYRK